MAVIKKDLPSAITFGSIFGRIEPIPLDPTALYYSLEDAKSYATTSGIAYVGQIVVVVDESNSNSTAYIIKDTAGNLQEIGAGGSSTMIVENQSEMLALEDIKNGQVVFVKDEGKSYILTNESDISNIASWTEISSGGSEWAGTENKVTFQATTYSEYTSGGKNEHTLYFITDKGMIFKGFQNVTSNFETVTEFDGEGAGLKVTDALEGRTYINPTTLEVRIKVLDSWVTLIPGYLTDGANFTQVDNEAKIATVKAIKDYVEKTLTEATKNKIDKMGEGNEDEIVLSTADGSVKRSSKKIGGETFSAEPDANTVATEKGVKALMSWKYIE